MSGDARAEYGHRPSRLDIRPQLRLRRLALSWILGALAVYLAAGILPGFHVGDFWAALLAALIIGILTALLPPLVAAVRLPYTVATTFLLVLLVDTLILRVADALTDGAIVADGFLAAFFAALVISAVLTALEIVLGANDDNAYSLHVIHRIARRSPDRVETDVPGILYLEIDGLARPVLQRAMRDGNAPNMARWLANGTHRLVEWETDTSSQTGASQAGILLGSNEDVPAFRWVEKERGELMVCWNPDDCAEIERRHAGDGLLRNGGASRGNLLSGEADHVLLTASRVSAEKKANPGYRAFFANGFNVTRSLALVGWEVVLELVAASRQRRRDVRPRGHRGGIYPLLRAGMCVVVRGPDGLRRAERPLRRAPSDLRDLRELRRGRASLRPRAPRHVGRTAQARSAIRAHRAGAPVRPAAVPRRRPLGPRPDPRGHVRAAQRLRARGPRPGVSRGTEGACRRG
jgi:uncharacterized membrane protein YvlD (DUF360 family)